MSSCSKDRYTETPGKKGNESMDSNCVSNIGVIRESSQNNYNKDCESRDDIGGELDEIIATMHGISSDNVMGQVQLGPILTALIEVEGETTEALLDTGSPVTIIRLETLLQLLAKQRCSSETPAEWRVAVESRLEPSAVDFRNYGGDKLRVVRQVKVTVGRSGYSTKAIIQVQKGAPAKLLVGTDLLSKLGYIFVQASEEGDDCDILNASAHNSNEGENKVNVEGENKVNVAVHEVTQQNVDDCDMSDTSNPDDGQNEANSPVPGEAQQKMEVEAPSLELGTVSLIQAVKIPARHQKLVRVQVTKNSFEQQQLIFEPLLTSFEENCLLAPEALVSLDPANRFNLILENHGWEPVYLESGQELGQVGRVVVCSGQDNSDNDDNVSLPSVHFLSTEQLADHEDSNVSVDIVNEQEKERISRLFKALNIDESNLMVDETALLRELVEEYSDIFALDSTELGTTELVTHSIDTGDSHPIRQPLRRISFALQRTMEEMVQNMLAQGVIQNSNSPWASPVVLIKKKDGSHRFCVDYRRLNGLTKINVFPLPRVDDTLDTLSQTQYFSTLDLAAGYWQVRMDRDSQERTAFSTCSGHYEFRVMPFGLCNGPSTFQRLMESVLMGLSRSRCMVYLDDVMVIGRNFTEHLENLREVFGRFRQANLKLQPEKCFLASSEVLYLGYVVSREGILADVQKVEAVQPFPRPTNLTSLHSFLGLASYYQQFIPNFSTVASPYYALTRKDAEFFGGSLSK